MTQQIIRTKAMPVSLNFQFHNNVIDFGLITGLLRKMITDHMVIFDEFNAQLSMKDGVME